MEASAPLSEPPKWVVWSTRESIDSDVPSVMAIVETLLAVPLYWWIAIHFAPYAPLMVSAAVAPLVLLRSDASVALGVRWFKAWESHLDDQGELSSRERSVVWASTGLVAAVCLIATFFVARQFLSGAEGWSAFWRAAAITWGAGAVAKALGTGPGAAAAAAAATAAAAAAGAAAAAAAAALVVAGGLAGAGAGAGAIAKMLVLPFMLLLLPISFGFAVGVFAVSLAIRIAATLRHVDNGVRALPRNFRRLVLCTSPKQVPELVPGIKPGETDATLPDLLQQLESQRSSNPVVAYGVVPIAMLMWFLPGWLYRLTLKSTAWFWWPLAFLGDELHQAKDPVLFHRQTMRSLWGLTSIVLAIATIATFVVVHFVLSGAIFRTNPLLTLAGLLLVVDWSLPPWQLLPLAAALLTVAMVYRLDYVRGEYQRAMATNNAPLCQRAERKFGRVERVLRFRLLLVLVFWLAAGGQALLYFNSLKCWFDMPANLARDAHWLYGDKLPQSPCLRDSP